MRKLLIILFLSIATLGYSQMDSGAKRVVNPFNKRRTPPAAQSSPDPKPEPTPAPQAAPVVAKKPVEVEQTSNFSMFPKDEFVNPGDQVADRLNKRTEGNQYQEVRRNQYLGDYFTHSPYIVVYYRDYGEIDGDKVRLMHNDKILLDEDFLEGNFKKFRIDLNEGINKIDVLALNTGTLYPNTAEYRIEDAEGGLITSKNWALSSGFRAMLVIIKE